MVDMILSFFLIKRSKNTCYTYIGKSREYIKNRQVCLKRETDNNVEIKKPSALSKYFENAKSLLNDECKTIV